MKRVYKYGTGDLVPDGAVYCGTITQTSIQGRDGEWYQCWLVWHYFIVEVPA